MNYYILTEDIIFNPQCPFLKYKNSILDEDIAILEKTTEVNNGDIVVALIDGQEATLKRFRKKTNSIALEPANKKFETRIFGLGRVIIQGKLVGIVRNY